MPQPHLPLLVTIGNKWLGKSRGLPRIQAEKKHRITPTSMIKRKKIFAKLISRYVPFCLQTLAKMARSANHEKITKKKKQ